MINGRGVRRLGDREWRGKGRNEGRSVVCRSRTVCKVCSSGDAKEGAVRGGYTNDAQLQARLSDLGKSPGPVSCNRPGPLQ